MKALIILVVASVILGCAEAQLPMIGTCTFTNYTLSVRVCNTEFIHSMQKNPKSNCSTELNAMYDCAVKTVKSCVPGINDATFKQMLQGMLPKIVMCDKAGVQYPGSMGKNASLPCNMTEQQYLKEVNNCSNALVSTWTSNRADPKICGQYKESKECIRKVINSRCDYSSIPWFKDLIKLSLGDYNPFCTSGVDPTTSPPDGQKTTANPKAGSQATSVKWVLVVGIAIVAMGF